jgi:hypothetical protein
VAGVDVAPCCAAATGGDYDRGMPTPDERFRQRAERVRRLWQQPGARSPASARLDHYPPSDPTVGAWRAILAGEHPLAAWLDGVEPVDLLPVAYSDGLSPRQLFSSHPFVDREPWSIRPTSRAS